LPEETDQVLKLVRAYRPTGRVSIRRIGSFVNDVFLVDVNGEKFVVKRYTNWISLKWVTLSLYGLGSVRFSISGRRRMEAEYAFNYLLSKRGLKVPDILGADIRSRSILFSYIPGDGLSILLARIAQTGQIGQREETGARTAGELMAGAHGLEAALGDTKPENFIVDRNGTVTLVDLEQARENGDYSWDVAEFLYYSGHYWLPFNGALSEYVDSFVKGYLESGPARILRKAASPKYVRIFSVWTPPNILLSIRKKLLEA
jgi:tRNA A-37 threonylcarbamoyl transferase component Bud32